MPTVKSFSASIVIGGEDVLEIEDPDTGDKGPNSRSRTCYIEAKEDQEFGVKLVVSNGRLIRDCDTLECKYIFDGVEQHGAILEKEDELRYSSYTCLCEASSFKRGGKWYEQKFRLAKLHLEDDSGNDSNLTYDDFGTISVEVWRYKNARKKRKTRKRKSKKKQTCSRHRYAESSSEYSSPWESSDPSDGDEEPHATPTLPEKAVKGRAIHIGASLSEPQDVESHSIVKGKTFGKSPIVVFNFKYRSLQALKELRLVPRTPTPVPLKDRPLESLTEAEKTELLLRYKNDAAAAKTKIKQETQEQTLRELQIMKRSMFEDGNDNEDDEGILEVASRRVKGRGPTAKDVVIALSD